MKRTLLLYIAAFALAAGVAAANIVDSRDGPIRIEPVVSGLDGAWAMAFLPDGGVLVTEKRGRLLYVANGRSQQVRGLPKVATRGQGGLLDVAVPRDFSSTRDVFVSYAAPGSAGTALGVGQLSQDGTRLRNFRQVFEMTGGNSGGRHFGSRIVEAPDGSIFLTVGDRGDDALAQDLSRHNGSVLRLNRDGSVPRDNPFVGQDGARPEIWSYGHRNPQGAALDADGNLWVHEHGARGGDEVNRVLRGGNYGWPVIAYGRHYSGGKIGEGTEKPGKEQPKHYWDPSIAPSGLTIYSGRLWPDWRGDFLVGSLKFDMISRLDGKTLREIERIEGPQTGRVRDVREAPDGSVWFISENNDTIYRMTPG